MILCPVRLEPTFSPRPWGSRSLAPFFPQMKNLAEPFGEAWMTGNESRFVDGPFAGKTLGQVWPTMAPEWTGNAVERGSAFPLLVKFIFTEEKLSVQVHPDDDYASRHERAAGGRGKTEMWYTLRAQPNAEVLVGLKPSVTRETFARAISDGTAENCLKHVPLRAGEAVFVPAGTAHTIGPGLVLCEIQEHSDLTYRVYDYNRRDAQGRARDLHIEKALQVMRFGAQNGGRIEPACVQDRAVKKTYLAACRYFATERWEFRDMHTTASSPEHFDLLIFLDGGGAIEWGSERVGYGPAQVWMIPATLGEYNLAPSEQTSLLRTFVPANLDDYARGMMRAGVTEAETRRILHR